MPPVAAPTLTVLMTPEPVSVPWVRVTAGETATLPAWTNLALAPLIVIPLVALSEPLPPRARAPLVTEVAPVKALAPDRVTVPAVVLSRPAAPPRMAETAPLRRS